MYRILAIISVYQMIFDAAAYCFSRCFWANVYKNVKCCFNI